jgi:hypothetical protein
MTLNAVRCCVCNCVLLLLLLLLPPPGQASCTARSAAHHGRLGEPPHHHLPRGEGHEACYVTTYTSAWWGACSPCDMFAFSRCCRGCTCLVAACSISSHALAMVGWVWPWLDGAGVTKHRIMSFRHPADAAKCFLQMRGVVAALGA